MSDKPGDATKGGMTFGSALALLFIGLKLGGVIDWSWWWALSPPLAAVLAFLCCLCAIAGACLVGAAVIEKVGGK
jgi:hypothetical protein